MIIVVAVIAVLIAVPIAWGNRRDRADEQTDSSPLSIVPPESN
jgi:hypothetical protein